MPPVPTPATAGAKAHVVLDNVGPAGPAGSSVAGALALPDDVAHHLRQVLRLRDGDHVTATDGRGSWCSTRFVARSGELEPTTATTHVPRVAPPVGIAFALTKGDKPELVVQKLTEIGVDRIVPFVAERSVVSWDADKAARNVARWRIVAREALRQSRQVWEPEVAAVHTFAELAALAGDSCDAGDAGAATTGAVVRADLGGDVPDPNRHGLVLIGPEGGWSPAEREAVTRCVTLGPSVLRAETAAIVAGALLAAGRNALVNAVR